VEPRAIPAAARGAKPRPNSGGGTTKPDSKTDTDHESGNNLERHKHLKSLVLGTEPADRRVQSRLTDHLTEEPYSAISNASPAADITLSPDWL